MKAGVAVLELLRSVGIDRVFGIPAGSVNVLFDGLNDYADIRPIITKHEGAAGYMAAGYAKYSGGPAVAIGSSGPGAMNMITPAANAMREQLPVLFLTGAVPSSTVGLNSSQELDAAPVFAPVTKYSKRVERGENLAEEVAKALEIALSGVPGPVHIAMPLDVQMAEIDPSRIPHEVRPVGVKTDFAAAGQAAREIKVRNSGLIFCGQGVRGMVPEVMRLSERLGWPVVSTPVAKGLFKDTHPNFAGVYGFAGHESTGRLVQDGEFETVLVLGSSLGETATSNYNAGLARDRIVIQFDRDETVFGRKYPVDLPVLGDLEDTIPAVLKELKILGAGEKSVKVPYNPERLIPGEAFTTKNVMLKLQQLLPEQTRYAVDITETEAYIIHDLNTLSPDAYDINVHFGAMGSGLSVGIAAKMAEPERPTVIITGDGCFHMHGMEILTAKEYQVPVLFIVMNNARLGLVYHGHSLQFKRVHETFSTQPMDFAKMAEGFGLPAARVASMEDLNGETIAELMASDGPALLEIVLTDDTPPPMGDRVKFLAGFAE
ncbi:MULTISPECIES: thiamine pyrophosphate-binding protein [Bhargavaea]|uniref:Thiamine pyrophosphate-binding protein n=1 Tax=Bhargavaea changchunensis TaxID=2134037 RepID=A0ABW2NGM1_9BACL|nr:thiamine pyrophosphate-binding protein [Bhargavaea sp. CC-171006]